MPVSFVSSPSSCSHSELALDLSVNSSAKPVAISIALHLDQFANLTHKAPMLEESAPHRYHEQTICVTAPGACTAMGGRVTVNRVETILPFFVPLWYDRVEIEIQGHDKAVELPRTKRELYRSTPTAPSATTSSG